MSGDNQKRGDGRGDDHDRGDTPPTNERGALGGDLDRYARGGPAGKLAGSDAPRASDSESGALGQDHADLWLARPPREADETTLPPVEESAAAFADKVLHPHHDAPPAEAAARAAGRSHEESGIGMGELAGSVKPAAEELTTESPAASISASSSDSASAGVPASGSVSASSSDSPAGSDPTPSPRSGGEGRGEGANFTALPSRITSSTNQPPHPTLSPAEPGARESSQPTHGRAISTSSTSASASASAPTSVTHSRAADRLLRNLGRPAPRASAPVAVAAPASLGRTSDAVRALRGGPSRVRKNLAVSQGLVLAIALLMSLLVHTTVGIMIARMPVGQFDASLIDKPERQFKVAPFKDDPIYRDPVLISEEPLPEPTKDAALADIGKLLLRTGGGGGDAAAVSAAALSQQIIKNSAATGTAAQGAGTANNPANEGAAVIASRVQHEDKQPVEARQAIVPTTTSSVEALPSDVATRLAGGAKVELPLNTGNAGTAPTDPRPATEGPTSSAAAKSLLKGSIGSAAFNTSREAPGSSGTGGTGTGVGGHIVGGRIAISDAAPTIDRRLLDGPPPPPSPIDIAALPIQDAVKLDVPEKLDDDFDIAFSKFRPEIGGGLFQAAKPDRYSYFRIDLSARRSLTKLKTIPKDVVFLIDTSGSVPQEWVNNMVSGVKDALSSLNDGDRFNIVFFAEKPSFFDPEKVQPVNTLNIAAAQDFLTKAKSAGDTDINRALGRLLARDLLVQRAYYLIFISDGVPTRGVMDNRELINTITRDNDLAASIYCVGVGYQQNRQLMDYLAYRNKGYSLYAKEPGDAATQIRELASRIRYPIIKGVNLNVIGLDLGEVFPHNLPNVHQGEKVSIYGRYETPSQFTMRVSGHNAGKGLDLTFSGNLATAPTGEKEIPELWGFWKLHHLYSEIIRRGETPAIKEQIKELKDRFDLKTLY